MFTCPVCFFDKMPDVAESYNICPCCGTEFGNDDEDRTHAQLREFWISSGAKWFFHDPPPMWNPWTQLALAGVRLPYATAISFSGSTERSAAAAHISKVYGLKYAKQDEYPLAEAA